MTLKDLVRVLPVYTMVHVHDKGDKVACQGNPHQFSTGLYKFLGDAPVHLVTAISPYHVEVVIEEVSK